MNLVSPAPVLRMGQPLQQRGRLETVEGKGALLFRETLRERMHISLSSRFLT